VGTDDRYETGALLTLRDTAGKRFRLCSITLTGRVAHERYSAHRRFPTAASSTLMVTSDAGLYDYNYFRLAEPVRGAQRSGGGGNKEQFIRQKW